MDVHDGNIIWLESLGLYGWYGASYGDCKVRLLRTPHSLERNARRRSPRATAAARTWVRPAWHEAQS